MRKTFVLVALSTILIVPSFAKADDAPAPQQVTLTIRDGATTAFTGTVDLPDAGSADVMITPTTAGATPVAVPARSVLSVLKTLDDSSDSFDITDLSYSSSFNSFLINCIKVPASEVNADCFNWTDAVNGSYPQVGVDHQILNDGDQVYLYFGSAHQTILSKTSVTTGESFTATAQQYDLASGTYLPLTGVTLGVGTSNPDFTFTELETQAVDTNGTASFTVNTAGTFSVGIKEDFYFPASTITVNAPASGGGGGGDVPTHPVFNLPKALSFLSAQQKPDGSFDSDITTDWAAVAFAASDPGAAKTKLHDYLLTATPKLSSVTDYERHAMALEALNINPYSGTPIDCITPILNSFDGTQIGDRNLDSDDIFAVFPLLHAGILQSDPMFTQIIQTIISSQKPDGSWDESPDMTGAAILAVGPFFTAPGYAAALGKSVGYLQSTQNSDGGWGFGSVTSVDSTSWVQTAINGIPVDPTHPFSWANPAGHLPMDAIAAIQQPDGSVLSASAAWSTSYAVTAASGTSWLTILQAFSKPTPITGGGGGDIPVQTPKPAPTPAPTPTTTPGQVLGTTTFAEGTLVKTTDSYTVYIVKNGKFLPFSSEKIFYAYGLKFSDVQIIGSDIITTDNTGAIMDYPDGTPHE